MSLIEVAQKLLALNPDAVELFKKANGKASLVRISQVFCVIHGGISLTCIRSEVKLLIVIVKISNTSLFASVCETLGWQCGILVYFCMDIMPYLHTCDDDDDDYYHNTFTPC